MCVTENTEEPTHSIIVYDDFNFDNKDIELLLKPSKC